jgi:PTS system mannose-specific IID component
VTTLLAVRMFLRSLLVQASWNFQRMQSLGFFFTIFPALARLHRRGSPELAQASLRHLQLFNTHPYFAGLVAGTVAHEEGPGGGGPELAAAIKRSLMCALGGVGDEFFWAHLRPLAALLALPFALGGRAWAPLVLLAVYNLPHLGTRAWGIAAGLRRGRGVAAVLEARPFTRALPWAGTALALVSGAVVGGFAARGPLALLPARPGLSAAAGLLLFLGLVALLARGVRLERLFSGAAVLAVLAGALRLAVAP